MAGKLNVPVSTVQGWKARGVIPASRHEGIRAAAAQHGIALDQAELAASAETPEEPAAAASEAASAPTAKEDAERAEPAGETPSPAADETAVSAPVAPPPPAADGERGAARRGGYLPGFMLGAVVFAVGAGGAVLTRDLWAPQTGSGADAALAERLAGLEAQLAGLETRPASGGPPSLEGLASDQDVERLSQALAGVKSRLTEAPPEVARLGERLEDLESRLDALGPSAAASAEAASALGGLHGRVEDLAGRLDDFDARIESLKSDQQARQSDVARETALWAAIGQLRDALRYSGAYAQHYDLVSRLAGDDAAVARLLAPVKGHKATGVPTLGLLRGEFPEVARRVVAAGRDDARDGVLGDVLRRVSEVVSIRQVGEIEGEGADAIVARAEVRLEQGDLAAAVAELKGLTDSAAEAAAGWRGKAEARLEADQAITQLTDWLSVQLSPGG